MSQFNVRANIAHPTDATRYAEAELFVDASATLSWIPREVIERIGVPRLGKRKFLVADGRTVERETAGVSMRLDGMQGIATVVLAEPGDASLPGATSLETSGYGAGPVGQKLIPLTLPAM